MSFRQKAVPTWQPTPLVYSAEKTSRVIHAPCYRCPTISQTHLSRWSCRKKGSYSVWHGPIVETYGQILNCPAHLISLTPFILFVTKSAYIHSNIDKKIYFQHLCVSYISVCDILLDFWIKFVLSFSILIHWLILLLLANLDSRCNGGRLKFLIAVFDNRSSGVTKVRVWGINRNANMFDAILRSKFYSKW